MIRRIISSILIIIVVGGCGIKGYVKRPKNDCKSVQITIEPKSEKEALLFERFYNYWCFRQQGLTEKAYRYELPYQQFIVPLKKYKVLSGKGYGAKSIKLLKIFYPDKEHNIAIIEREIELNKDEKVNKKDKWFYIKNHWYHKFYQSAFPPESVEEAEYQ